MVLPLDPAVSRFPQFVAETAGLSIAPDLRSAEDDGDDGVSDGLPPETLFALHVASLGLYHETVGARGARVAVWEPTDLTGFVGLGDPAAGRGAQVAMSLTTRDLCVSIHPQAAVDAAWAVRSFFAIYEKFQPALIALRAPSQAVSLRQAMARAAALRLGGDGGLLSASTLFGLEASVVRASVAVFPSRPDQEGGEPLLCGAVDGIFAAVSLRPFDAVGEFAVDAFEGKREFRWETVYCIFFFSSGCALICQSK